MERRAWRGGRRGRGDSLTQIHRALCIGWHCPTRARCHDRWIQKWAHLDIWISRGARSGWLWVSWLDRATCRRFRETSHLRRRTWCSANLMHLQEIVHARSWWLPLIVGWVISPISKLWGKKLWWQKQTGWGLWRNERIESVDWNRGRTCEVMAGKWEVWRCEGEENLELWVWVSEGQIANCKLGWNGNILFGLLSLHTLIFAPTFHPDLTCLFQSSVFSLPIFHFPFRTFTRRIHASARWVTSYHQSRYEDDTVGAEQGDMMMIMMKIKRKRKKILLCIVHWSSLTIFRGRMYLSIYIPAGWIILLLDKLPIEATSIGLPPSDSRPCPFTPSKRMMISQFE